MTNLDISVVAGCATMKCVLIKYVICSADIIRAVLHVKQAMCDRGFIYILYYIILYYIILYYITAKGLLRVCYHLTLCIFLVFSAEDDPRWCCNM
jgi:hypothetical protein